MSNEDEIGALIETWARAVSAGNRKAILAHHSPDLVMFDFPNVIVHEHHSVRTIEERFTGPATR